MGLTAGDKSESVLAHVINMYIRREMVAVAIPKPRPADADLFFSIHGTA
jgi:hypothetical protein